MSDGTSKSPSDPDPGCVAARHLLAKFIAAQLSPEENTDFRGHIVGCAECRLAYRETIASAAHWKHAAESASDSETRRIERQERRKRAIAQVSSGRISPWRLKMVLVPAAMIVLLSGMGTLWKRTPYVIAHWEAGTAQAAGLPMDGDRDEAKLEVGDSCVTEREARVYVEGAGGRFELGSDTRLIVEDARKPRVRLLSGSLLLEGRGMVSTQLGIVTLEEGTLRMSKSRAQLQVDCLHGKAHLTNAGIEQEIVQGQRGVARVGEIVVEAFGN